MIPKPEVISQEKNNLREELRDLKSYQFKLWGVAAVVTGFLLSLTRLDLDTSANKGTLSSAFPAQSLYLLPLIVILPSWFIYFDKGKTITHIVGYCRILEAIQNEETTFVYIGWERSLRKFRASGQSKINKVKRLRKEPLAKRLKGFVEHLWLTITMIQSQRYWALAYATFLALSVVCLVVPIRSRISLSGPFFETFFLWAAVICTFLCSSFNGVVLSRLLWGQHSYDFMEDVWKEILTEPSGDAHKGCASAASDTSVGKK